MLQQPQSVDISSTPISSSFNIASSESQQAANLSLSQPQAFPPNNNNNIISRRRNCYLSLWRLVVAILLLLVLVSVVNYIAWRILNPLPPVFAVRSFNISNIMPTNTPLGVDADYDIVFTVSNPNRKMRLLMDYFEIHLFQGERKTNNVPKELEPSPTVSVCMAKNSTEKFVVHVRKVHLLQKDGVISFNIQLNVEIRFSPTNWLPKRKFIELHCRNLAVRFSTSKGRATGDLIDGRSGKCSIYRTRD